MKYQNINLHDALKSVAGQSGLSLDIENELTVVLRKPKARNAESVPARHATGVVGKKLDSIIIRYVYFSDADINSVISYLDQRGKRNDPDKKGVDIVLMDKENKSRIDISLDNVTLHKALELIAEMAGLELEINEAQAQVLLKSKEKK